MPEEQKLQQSALSLSSIATLPPMGPNVAQPSAQHADSLPCEPRFIIRLPDDEQGQSRWTTPEAMYLANQSRYLPPTHPASQDWQLLHPVKAAEEDAERRKERQDRQQEDAQEGQQEEQTGDVLGSGAPIQIVGDTRSGPVDAGEQENEQGEDKPPTESGQLGEDVEMGGLARTPNPDPMSFVRASCSRCVDQQKRCNRRQPCQHCLNDGLGEDACTARRADSEPEDSVSTLINQLPSTSIKSTSQTPPPPALAQEPSPSDVDPTAATDATESQVREGRLPVRRFTLKNSDVTSSSSSAAENSPRESRNTGKRGGRWGRGRNNGRSKSPRPFFGNFPTDEEIELQRQWDERHKDNE